MIGRKLHWFFDFNSLLGEGICSKSHQLSSYIQVFRLFQGFLHTLPKIFHKIHIDPETLPSRNWLWRPQVHPRISRNRWILDQLIGLRGGKPPMIYRFSIILLMVEMSQPSTVWFLIWQEFAGQVDTFEFQLQTFDFWSKHFFLRNQNKRWECLLFNKASQFFPNTLAHHFVASPAGSHRAISLDLMGKWAKAQKWQYIHYKYIWIYIYIYDIW